MGNQVIAMDGPSGSGKSSTARGVAQQLCYRYLDTGAQFRALTYWMLAQQVSVRDAVAVAKFAEQPKLTSGTDPRQPEIWVDGQEVSEEIRSDAVTAAVSYVAAVPAIRDRLLRLQREIIGTGQIVVEGRDIGSVVFPEADLKLYLTADPQARATRRALENSGEIAEVAAALAARDKLDSGRKAAPLVVPAGAIHLDTTNDTLEQVIAQVVGLAREIS